MKTSFLEYPSKYVSLEMQHKNLTVSTILIIIVFLMSGNYSQRIFTKLDHTTLNSVNYDDFRDENGELYLKDTREHVKIITCFKKLSK